MAASASRVTSIGSLAVVSVLSAAEPATRTGPVASVSSGSIEASVRAAASSRGVVVCVGLFEVRLSFVQSGSVFVVALLFELFHGDCSLRWRLVLGLPVRRRLSFVFSFDGGFLSAGLPLCRLFSAEAQLLGVPLGHGPHAHFGGRRESHQEPLVELFGEALGVFLDDGSDLGGDGRADGVGCVGVVDIGHVHVEPGAFVVFIEQTAESRVALREARLRADSGR